MELTEGQWQEVEYLIAAQVKKVGYNVPGYDTEDLIQECLLAVVSKIENYNESKGALSTFVWIVSKGALWELINKANRQKRSGAINTLSLDNASIIVGQKNAWEEDKKYNLEREVSTEDLLERVLETEKDMDAYKCLMKEMTYVAFAKKWSCSHEQSRRIANALRIKLKKYWEV